METRWGKRLGRYEIVAELGRGSMGVVYKARDPKIDRFVAVKAISVLEQNPAELREYRDRFFHEAQAAGRLLHPGIVTIFDVGEESERRDPYIVMEFVSGKPLNRMCGQAKPLQLESALEMTEQIAEALDYAHGQGVIHRDIKPANILITKEGHAKIADFGIAKMNLAHLTIPGRVLGTPAYMSPEQLEGEAVDGRSDLFSLGVVMYFMITGYSPFQGNSATTVCFKIANRDPLPATSFDPGLPPELDAILRRAMAKDPSQRYQRGIEFALDVRELRERTWQNKTNPAMVIPAQPAHATAGVGGTANAVTPSAEASVVSTNLVQRHISVNQYMFIFASILAVALAFVLFKAMLVPAELPAQALLRHVAAPVAPLISPTSAANLAATAKAVPKRLSQSRVSPRPAAPVELANLDLQVQHHFTDAQLSLWVDEHLTYSRALHGENKTRLVVVHGVQGYETAQVQVPTGKHSLRVHVQSSEDSFDESKTITAELAKGEDKTLRIDFDKHNREMRVALR